MKDDEKALSEEVAEELEWLLDVLVGEYQRICPSQRQLEESLLNRGEELSVDHLGIRTFAVHPISLDNLAPVFTSRGYRESGHYHFPEKHLRARSFSPPMKKYPRIFLSELLPSGLSPENWEKVCGWLECLDSDVTGENLLGASRNWPPIDVEDFRALEGESQYASWVAAHGIRVNHQAWSVNALMSLDGLEDIHEFGVQEGMTWKVQGSSERSKRVTALSQSSTCADVIPISFANGTIESISGGYVEFAHRFRDPSGQGLFDGFIAPQANDIFESTRRTPS